MIPTDFSGKVALITGVGDNESFAWYIAKALNAAGAKIVLASHPRMVGIVDTFLTRESDKESRELPYGKGELKVEKLLPCDVSYDTMADVPEEIRTDRRFAKFPEYSIQGTVDAVGKEFGGIDILVHSVAFSREITKSLIDTSRKAYHEAMGISAYSLISLTRAAAPYMANRPGGASVVGLTYVAGERVVPHYGGGMGTCKSALQMDAKQLAWFVGDKDIRVNLVSAGPYASRAARAIQPGKMEKLIEYTAERSPLRRAITPEEVADATLFLCSPWARGVTGQVLYVDAGYNVMGG
ncbi:MAG: SDR family oxidoreductase [Fimbriiglobus sp.]